ncbi:MAG: single-stranded DNA-binding protein [Nitriliruptoraceae bacterium]
MTVAARDDGQVAVEQDGDHNQVRLVGTLSGTVEQRVLPSGDELAQFRLVVHRPDRGADTIPVRFGPAPPSGQRRHGYPVGRRALGQVLRLPAGSRIEVAGSLRRRWWAAGAARRSRIEVAASSVRALEPLTA